MAGDQPTEEWTVTTQGNAGWDHFVFNLKVDSNGKITGKVSELPTDEEGTVVGVAKRLGSVKGRQDPVQGSNLSLMTMVFKRRRTRIVMAGIRDMSSAPNTLNGRFSSFRNWRNVVIGTNLPPLTAHSNDLVVAPGAPVEGDTGTATGTQT